MKEVTAVIKANVTVVYNVKDEDSIKTVDDFNREFAAAMRNEEPFTFDHIQAISVKNFVMDEPKKHCGRYPWESAEADTIAPAV
jgi:hypothetical protein